MAAGFTKEGFLSDAMPNWVKIHRRRHSDWFALAEDLNRLAHTAWSRIDARVDQHDIWQFSAGLLFLRGLSSFQSALILAQHGLTTDAGTVIRSGFETVFCLGAGFKDKELVSTLIRADTSARRKTADALLRMPDHLELDGPDLDRLKEFLQSVDEGQKLDFANMARKAEMTPFCDIYYRGLSHDSAHPSIESLRCHADETASGEVAGFRYDADSKRVAQVVAYTCSMGVLLIESALKTFPSEVEEMAHTELVKRYCTLSQRDFSDG